MRWLAAAILLGLASIVLLALALGGATTSADPPAASDTPAGSDTTAIAIEDGQFVPNELTVPVGSTVTWTNLDRGAYHVISDDDSFDSGPLTTDQTFSWQFDTPGSFSYHSHRPGMNGSIVVQAPDADSPSLATEPPTILLDPAPSPGALARDRGGPPSPTSDPGIPTLEAQSSVAEPQPAPATLGAVASPDTVTIDSGNLWFCDPSFQNGVCDTTINVGDTVTWNFIEGFHDATECGQNFANSPNCAGAQWGSPTQQSPFTWSHTFNATGTYYYICTVHPTQMRGRVIVQAAAATPTPTPTPAPGATPTPTPAPGATPTPTSTPTPGAAAGGGALPAGGGPPGDSGGSSATLALLAGSAVAFVASAFAFRRWYRASRGR